MLPRPQTKIAHISQPEISWSVRIRLPLYSTERTLYFLMSSESDDHRITRYSSEHYDPVGADLDWSIILAAASPIFFGFLLNIAVNPPSYFTFFDNVIL